MVMGMALVSAVTRDNFRAYPQPIALCSTQNESTLGICHPNGLGTVNKTPGLGREIWAAFDVPSVHITKQEG